MISSIMKLQPSLQTQVMFVSRVFQGHSIEAASIDLEMTQLNKISQLAK